MNRKDYRSVQTEHLARMALIKLMESTPLEKITVTALCKEAGINRNTFYAHYYRPEDVYEQIFNNWQISIQDFSDFGDPKAIIAKYVELLIKHDDLLKLIKHTDIIHNFFFQRLLKAFQNRVLEAWQELRPDLSLDELTMRYLFVEGGSIAIILKWVDNDLADPANYIANSILDLAWQTCGDIWGAKKE